MNEPACGNPGIIIIEGCAVTAGKPPFDAAIACPIACNIAGPWYERENSMRLSGNLKGIKKKLDRT